MDDTIICWATTPDSAWKNLCRLYAPETNGLEAETLLAAINRVRDRYWADPQRHREGRLDLPKARREVLRLALTSLDIANASLAEKIADAYTAAREQDEFVAPESMALLKTLREKGIRLALVTNGGSEIQRGKINKFRLAPYFDNILVEGEFGCGKPDERVFLHTLEKLKVKPADAWMVGDDLERDIAPCHALGIYTLWVDGKGTGLPASDGARPDKIIRNISEIPGLL
jgi:putative hydrolase of the HAD superfamily